ncbi:MAG: AIR synthase-related protein, partial [Gammaproteobacteria bacterium]|nr:AIR synthase-related protein [Gammaproteobacteria bacterium]
KCIESMELSNRQAAALFREFDASAVTDISGFGLVGHCAELVRQSTVSIELFANSVTLLPSTQDLLNQGIKSTLHDANVQALEEFEIAADVEEQNLAPLVDPQTSGGLLAAVPSAVSRECLSALADAGYQHAAIVGRTVDEKSSRILN